MTISDYNDNIIDKLEENAQFNFTKDDTRLDITDISLATDENGNKIYDLDVDKYFTRVLQVTSTVNKQTYTKVVYITGMPSFLKYALGSRGHLTLNGSVYLKEGNLYANTGLTVTNTARYVYGGNYLEENTSFPSVYNPEKSLLFLEQENIGSTSIRYCKDNCYSAKNEVSENFKNLQVNSENIKFLLDNAFKPNPTYIPDKTEFVDVNIPITFLEKLKDGGFYNQNIDTENLSTQEILDTIDSIIATGDKNSEVKVIDKITNDNQTVNILLALLIILLISKGIYIVEPMPILIQITMKTN